MAQPQTLEELISKNKLDDFSTGDNNFLLKCLEAGLSSIIEAEVASQIGAKPYERNLTRNTSRNGYRERTSGLKTSLGKIALQIPKLRNGSYYPSFLEDQRYSRVERSLIGVIQQAYIQGVSTRGMEKLFHELGIDKLDKSTVSSLIQPLFQEVENWRNRSLDNKYKFIWLDAIYMRVREDGAIRKKAVLVAIGVNYENRREVLGCSIGQSEAETNWFDFLKTLNKRGICKANLWICDAHEGLNNAVSKIFPGQLTQRCIVHWQRNFLDKLNSKKKVIISSKLSTFVRSRSKFEFETNLEILKNTVKENLDDNQQDWFFDTVDEILNFLIFDEKYYNKIKSTNPIERLNEELRRREKKIRIFPNCKSMMILVASILQQFSDEWVTGRKYI